MNTQSDPKVQSINCIIFVVNKLKFQSKFIYIFKSKTPNINTSKTVCSRNIAKFIFYRDSLFINGHTLQMSYYGF